MFPTLEKIENALKKRISEHKEPILVSFREYPPLNTGSKLDFKEAYLKEIRDLESITYRSHEMSTYKCEIQIETDDKEPNVISASLKLLKSAERMRQIVRPKLRYIPEVRDQYTIATFMIEISGEKYWCYLSTWLPGTSLLRRFEKEDIETLTETTLECLNYLVRMFYHQKHWRITLHLDAAVILAEYIPMAHYYKVISSKEYKKIETYVKKTDNLKIDTLGSPIHGDASPGNFIIDYMTIDGQKYAEVHAIDIKYGGNDYLKDIAKMITIILFDTEEELQFYPEYRMELAFTIIDWLVTNYSEDETLRERFIFWTVRHLLTISKYKQIEHKEKDDDSALKSAKDFAKKALKLIELENKLLNPPEEMFSRAQKIRVLYNERTELIDEHFALTQTFDSEEMNTGTRNKEKVEAEMDTKDEEIERMEIQLTLEEVIHQIYPNRRKFREKIIEGVNKFLNLLQSNPDILVIGHNDVDGISCIKIIIELFEILKKYYDFNYLTAIFDQTETLAKIITTWDEQIVFVLDLRFVEHIGDFDFKNRQLFIIDHHVKSQKEHSKSLSSENIFEINGEHFDINASKELSGASTTYLFAKETVISLNLKKGTKEAFNPLAWFAILGTLGDSFDQGQCFTGFNREIMEDAIESGRIQVNTKKWSKFSTDDIKKRIVNAELKNNDDLENLMEPEESKKITIKGKNGLFSDAYLLALIIDVLGIRETENIKKNRTVDISRGYKSDKDDYSLINIFDMPKATEILKKNVFDILEAIKRNIKWLLDSDDMEDYIVTDHVVLANLRDIEYNKMISGFIASILLAVEAVEEKKPVIVYSFESIQFPKKRISHHKIGVRIPFDKSKRMDARDFVGALAKKLEKHHIKYGGHPTSAGITIDIDVTNKIKVDRVDWRILVSTFYDVYYFKDK